MSANKKSYGNLKVLLNSFFILVAFSTGVELSFGQRDSELINFDQNFAADFQGKTLEDFFSSAIIFSPTLKIAEEQFKIGATRRQAANGELLPQLRANGSVSENTRNTSSLRQEFDGNRYSIQLTQTLFNWQAYVARSRAYLREDAAEVQYYNELSFLLTDVAEKYFSTLQTQDSVNSIEAELNAVQNQLRQIEQMYERQLTQITDLYQAQARVAAIQSQKIQLQSELAQNYQTLKSVSGISVGELNVLSETLTIPRSPNKLNDWLAIGEANNHLIKIRKLELEEAAKGISQEKGAYLPQVSLIVQRQDSDVGFDNRPIDRSDNTYVGVDVTIPLYAGGKNLARIREAKSIREIAASELRKAQLEIRKNIRAAYLRLEASESIISAATLLLDSTTLNATAMQRGFELGAVTSVDVLEALQEQYRSERDLQRARYDQINSLLVLKREAGNLTIDDLIEVGSWLSPASPN